jgi:predicted polyphosphate/ATP-dependent NAD kinase
VVKEDVEETLVIIGFIINPVAGMGGKVGLKGTDGAVEKAVEMGAKPVSPKRAREFLRRLKEVGVADKIRLIACPANMGKREAEAAGVGAEILPMNIESDTTAQDTKDAVKLLMEQKVDLILFVGGDGTARDILDAYIGENGAPVLGIPAGVKMYSGVFAVNSEDAVIVVKAFLNGEVQLVDFEIMDADEKAIRDDRFNVKLYGFLKGPFLPMRIQGSKQASPDTLDEYENQKAIARFIVEDLDPEAIYILGPGTTIKCVTDLLGVEKTLLGVDVYSKEGMMMDVNEKKILESIDDWQRVRILVSPIGRQGILLGRGNQQISPKVIKLVDREKIAVLATKGKIQSIEDGVLRVDTGDEGVDEMLRGFIKVATDYREWRLLEVR